MCLQVFQGCHCREICW